MKWPLRLAAFAVPFLIAAPLLQPVSAQVFQWREPRYAIPLALDLPVHVRKDAFGSGLFGAPRSGGRAHRGLDLLAPVGTEVLAAKSGVAKAGRLKNGLGRYVEVHHPDGTMTLYAHLREIRVRDGRRVRQGNVVGTVGRSGNAQRRAIRPHLHFEIWDTRGNPVDPLPLLLNREVS